MKLDRNINTDGKGKYALVNMRRLDAVDGIAVREAMALLSQLKVIEFGIVGEKDEFFVMKLKDINSLPAIEAYAKEAEKSDPEWAEEVRTLIPRAGVNSKYSTFPD